MDKNEQTTEPTKTSSPESSVASPTWCGAKKKKKKKKKNNKNGLKMRSLNSQGIAFKTASISTTSKVYLFDNYTTTSTSEKFYLKGETVINWNLTVHYE